MIRKISDWFGLNFNPKLSPGKVGIFQATINFEFNSTPSVRNLIFEQIALKGYVTLSLRLENPSKEKTYVLMYLLSW